MKLQKLKDKIDAHGLKQERYLTTIELYHKFMSEEVDKWIAEHELSSELNPVANPVIDKAIGGMARVFDIVVSTNSRVKELEAELDATKFNLNAERNAVKELSDMGSALHIKNKELEAELDELHKATSEFIIQKLNSGMPLSISSDKVIT